MNTLRTLCLCAALTLLQACGGGGGGGGNSSTTGGGGTPTGAAEGPTGLVPTAGSPGTVLRQQASVLRPLKAGSRWVYRRIDYTGATTEEVEVWQSSTTTTTGAVRETDSEEADAFTDVRIDADGHIRVATNLLLAPGATPIAVDALELRSPVRANEQILVIDKRITQSGIDRDRDGKADTVDLAIWRNVAGVEPVTLPNNPVPVDAVRVDTTTVVRITPSAGGASVTATQKLSTWYADGLGVVREAEAASSGARLWDTDEVLIGYDGVTSGYGFVSAPTGEGWAFDGPRAVLKLVDGVLLSDSDGIRRLDSRGRSLSFYLFTPNNLSADLRGLARFGTRSVAFNRRIATSGVGFRYDLHDISAAGEPTQTPAASFEPFDLSPAQSINDDPILASLPGSNLLWVVFHRSVLSAIPSAGYTSEFVVRRHDGSNWVGGETRLAFTEHRTPGSLSLQSLSNGLMLAWSEFNSYGVTTQHSVRVDETGQVAAHGRLILPSAALGRDPYFTLIGDGDTAWALWTGPSAVAGMESAPHGVRLDAQASPVGISSDDASLRAATLAGLDGIATDTPFQQQMSAGGRRWVLAANNYGKAYPDDTRDRFWLDYRRLDPGSAAPSAGLTTTLRLRLPDRRLAAAPIVFETHTLLLTPGPSGRSMRPTIVWHR